MDPQRKRIRPIDVLAVAAVLLGVVSLVIPGAAVMRERSRRLSCESNLKALGAAMLSYHQAHRTFPPGIVAHGEPRRENGFDHWISQYVADSERCDDPGAARTSALTLILPFLEERATFKAYNTSLACCAVQNATAVATRVRAFLCPANNFKGIQDWAYYQVPFGFAANGPATTDYALSIGGTGLITDDYPDWARHGTYRWPGVSWRAAGTFNVKVAVRIDSIKDGAARTFLMGEAFSGVRAILRADGRMPQGDEPMDGGESSFTVGTPWSQGFLGGEPRHERGQLVGNHGGFGSVFAATAWNAWYGPDRNLAAVDQWFPLVPNEGGADGARATYYQGPTPNVNIMATDGTGIPGSIGSVQGFRSRHVTLPMLFADGSVRQIKPTIDPKLWVALSTVNGREPIPTDF